MMTTQQPIPVAVNIILWLLTLFITYTFATSCYNMLNGDKSAAVETLNKHGDKTLRYTVAALQGISAIVILWPSGVVIGSALGAIAMIGVLSADMSSMGGIPEQPVVMLVLTLVLVVSRLKYSARNPLKDLQ